MAEVTNEFPARMIDSRFKALAADISDTIIASICCKRRSMRSPRCGHEEISVVHDQLNHLRQTVTRLRAEVEELKPATLNGNGSD